MAEVARTNLRLKALKPKGVRAMQAGLARAYDASATGGRVSGWMASGSGPNAVVMSSVHEMRRKVRQMVRNNGWAAASITTLASETIGSGIKPMSKSPDRNFQAAAQEHWADWAMDADADGVLDLYGLQTLAAREVYEAGEVFLLKVRRNPDDAASPVIQYRMIEPEQVPVELDRIEPNGHVIRQGVEFDAAGNRVAYHVYRYHPSDAVQQIGSGEIIRIPADDMLHVFRPLRAGQIRGLPNLAPVLLKIFDLDGYEDAELVRKKVAALMTGFITTPDPEDTSLVNAATAENAADATGAVSAALVPGGMNILKPGQEVEFSSPADVGGSYDPFLTWNLRAFAAGIGLSYEQVTGDLTKVNYSSLRAGTLKQRRKMRQDQHQIFARQFCLPIWREVITTGVMAGDISVANFESQRRKHLRVQWMPEGFEWVDPVKEQAAEQSAVRNGFKSRQSVVAQLGRDIDVVDGEIKADNDRADSLELVLDTDPRRVTKVGTMQSRFIDDDETESAETESAETA